ncbi:uncharacterized protein LOC114968238 [Acropora millepora]|uniref:uncharacterized protein LOC114968238 n=1 Tax=Acropora millepora TaxID=45264 RepID=UPI001CF0E7B4|nr:uncharacterized protein LOC114968238 [Acropora millepora]
MDSAGETVSESEWKVAARNIISNATTRNIIDLLLVLVILVLLTLAAPVIRGDCNHGDKIEIHGQESPPCNDNHCCGECRCQTGFTGKHPDCTGEKSKLRPCSFNLKNPSQACR